MDYYRLRIFKFEFRIGSLIIIIIITVYCNNSIGTIQYKIYINLTIEYNIAAPPKSWACAGGASSWFLIPFRKQKI